MMMGLTLKRVLATLMGMYMIGIKYVITTVELTNDL